ncbi:MAG TPA: hypothetical protein VD866_12905, partial [Urbifossiella sp.]|nr:hypothetical protein [Urbifossiella sp.]
LVETYDDWPLDDPLVRVAGAVCHDCHQAKPCRPCLRFVAPPPPDFLGRGSGDLPRPAEMMLCRPCFEKSPRT